MPQTDTPVEAFRRFHRPIEKALGCITARRLLIPRTRDLIPGRLNAIVLNQGDPVPLKGVSPVALSFLQEFGIVEDALAAYHRFDVETIRYQYQFAMPEGEKLLTFQWTPETTDPGQKTFPHLHIETSMLAERTPLLPGRFNKTHVPTGKVTIGSIVRFAIEEPGVRPLTRDWRRAVEEVEEGRKGR